MTRLLKSFVKTPSYLAALIERRIKLIEPDIAPIQSLLSRIVDGSAVTSAIASAILAFISFILFMCDVKAFVFGPQSLEPSDSPREPEPGYK